MVGKPARSLGSCDSQPATAKYSPSQQIIGKYNALSRSLKKKRLFKIIILLKWHKRFLIHLPPLQSAAQSTKSMKRLWYVQCMSWIVRSIFKTTCFWARGQQTTSKQTRFKAVLTHPLLNPLIFAGFQMFEIQTEQIAIETLIFLFKNRSRFFPSGV